MSAKRRSAVTRGGPAPRPHSASGKLADKNWDDDGIVIDGGL